MEVKPLVVMPMAVPMEVVPLEVHGCACGGTPL